MKCQPQLTKLGEEGIDKPIAFYWPIIYNFQSEINPPVALDVTVARTLDVVRWYSVVVIDSYLVVVVG